ncbi:MULTISPECIES: hypothetical protein [Burkholderia]|uniref:hypothetical protein n=1 Tax=Burkholderia TaxID=32008 RepID=UPI000A61E304|nr:MULTISPECIES: hypothetical protein [Burkholderia]
MLKMKTRSVASRKTSGGTDEQTSGRMPAQTRAQRVKPTREFALDHNDRRRQAAAGEISRKRFR